MPSILREAELLKPVSGNLRKQGYRKQQDEVQFFEYRMDIYGYASKTDRTTAVELKLHRWMRAFEQALIYKLCADYVYLALPAKTIARVEMPLLVTHGLGLICVENGHKCDVVLEAVQSTIVLPHYRDFYIQLMQKGTG